MLAQTVKEAAIGTATVPFQALKTTSSVLNKSLKTTEVVFGATTDTLESLSTNTAKTADAAASTVSETANAVRTVADSAGKITNNTLSVIKRATGTIDDLVKRNEELTAIKTENKINAQKTAQDKMTEEQAKILEARAEQERSEIERKATRDIQSATREITKEKDKTRKLIDRYETENKLNEKNKRITDAKIGQSEELETNKLDIAHAKEKQLLAVENSLIAANALINEKQEKMLMEQINREAKKNKSCVDIGYQKNTWYFYKPKTLYVKLDGFIPKKGFYTVTQICEEAVYDPKECPAEKKIQVKYGPDKNGDYYYFKEVKLPITFDPEQITNPEQITKLAITFEPEQIIKTSYVAFQPVDLKRKQFRVGGKTRKKNKRKHNKRTKTNRKSKRNTRRKK